MVDYSLIKQMRVRGKTYDEIADTLHVSKSTISMALKVKNGTLKRSASHPTSLHEVIYQKNGTLFYKSSPTERRPGSISEGAINKKTMLIAGSAGGLYLTSMDPGPSSSSQLINAPLPSWFWKLFFISLGIVMFIKILKRMGGSAFENE